MYSHRRILEFVAAGLLLSTLAIFGLQGKQGTDAALKNSGKTGEEWLTVGLNYAEPRFSQLKQIDTTNVSRLGLAWTYEMGNGGGNQEATPMFANGMVYGITNWSITFAVDARTGKEVWRYDPMVRPQSNLACMCMCSTERRQT
jgi:quinohemoprotein ethanol dehydrogenase